MRVRLIVDTVQTPDEVMVVFNLGHDYEVPVYLKKGELWSLASILQHAAVTNLIEATYELTNNNTDGE
jgi:hypothetical protein